MEILEAFDLTNCAHSAAQLVGADPKTVARYVAVRDGGNDPFTRRARPKLIDPYLEKIEELVERSTGKVRADVVHHDHLVPMGFVGDERTSRPKENTPMTTLDQPDVSGLLDALRAGDGVDLIRDLLRLSLQELVEAEAAVANGADRYERSEGRLTARNGHREKTIATKAGDLEVKGSYFRSFLQPWRRIDQALYAVVMEAYVKGVFHPVGR